MTTTQSAVRRWKSYPALVAAICLSVATFTATSADAATKLVSGQFTFAAASPLDCPLGSLVCTKGEFTGTLVGSFTNVVTILVASPTVGVSFFSGNLTLHAKGGDLRCGLNGALNALSVDGEFAEICVITGGTGGFRGAKGHLELTGTSSANPPVLGEEGTGTYTGTIYNVGGDL